MAAVRRPGQVGGNGARGTRRDGSDGASTTANTVRSRRAAVVCTGPGGSHRWVLGAGRTRSVDSESSWSHTKIPVEIDVAVYRRCAGLDRLGCVTFSIFNDTKL